MGKLQDLSSVLTGLYDQPLLGPKPDQLLIFKRPQLALKLQGLLQPATSAATKHSNLSVVNQAIAAMYEHPALHDHVAGWAPVRSGQSGRDRPALILIPVMCCMLRWMLLGGRVGLGRVLRPLLRSASSLACLLLFSNVFFFFFLVGYRGIVHPPSDDGGTQRTWFVPEHRPRKQFLSDQSKASKMSTLCQLLLTKIPDKCKMCETPAFSR